MTPGVYKHLTAAVYMQTALIIYVHLFETLNVYALKTKQNKKQKTKKKKKKKKKQQKRLPLFVQK